MSCSPNYTFVPPFTSSSSPCAAPVIETHRSRCMTLSSSTATSLFFRSINQSFESNLISVRLTKRLVNNILTPMFDVLFDGILVKEYPVQLEVPGEIGTLRDRINLTDPNDYIEMPAINFDIYDMRTAEDDGDGDGILTPGLNEFMEISLNGGSGPPSTDELVSLIRTGPQRTIVIIRSKEDITGTNVFPPPSERIIQWNGNSWISYCNNVQGQCPGNGTC